MDGRRRRRWLGLLAAARLAAAGLLLVAGALVVFPAPTYRFWLVSVALTEFGYLVAPLALALLWPGFHRTASGRASAAGGVVAAACLLTPMVRALPVAQGLPDRLEAAFGTGAHRPLASEDAPARARPIEIADLFAGVRTPEVAVERLAYARRGDRTLSMDLYRRARPADAPPVPIVVLVHGGGWTSGRPDDLPELPGYLAARGYLVAAPEYRLAPRDRFPAAVEDLRAAVDLLRGRARDWGAAPDGVVLIGRSAGAHLALLLAYTASIDAVRGVVGLYGPADLRFGWEHPGSAWVYDGTGAIEAFLGGGPTDVPAAYAASSAYDLASAGAPPTLLIHGRKDELVWVEQSRRMAARLAALGRPHLLLELPWATHGCDFALMGPCGQLTVFAVERFLAAVTAH